MHNELKLGKKCNPKCVSIYLGGCNDYILPQKLGKINAFWNFFFTIFKFQKMLILAFEALTVPCPAQNGLFSAF